MAHAQTHGAASVSAIAGFGRYWFLVLGAAVVSAIAANMFIGLPLGTVVEVLLAVLLVGLILAEVYFAVRGIGFLLTGRSQEALVWLGAMVIYLLLLFPPLLAFDGYAWYTGQQIAGSSHLYDNLTGAIGSVFKFPAQLISAALVLVFHAGSGYVNYVTRAKIWLEIGANALSIVVALQTLSATRGRSRDREP